VRERKPKRERERERGKRKGEEGIEGGERRQIKTFE